MDETKRMLRHPGEPEQLQEIPLGIASEIPYWQQPEVLRSLIERELRARGGGLEPALLACRRGRPSRDAAQHRDLLAQAVVALLNPRYGAFTMLREEPGYTYDDQGAPITAPFYTYDSLEGVTDDDLVAALGLSSKSVQRLVRHGYEQLKAAEQAATEAREAADDIQLRVTTTPEEMRAAIDAVELREVMGVDEPVDPRARAAEALGWESAGPKL